VGMLRRDMAVFLGMGGSVWGIHRVRSEWSNFP
jgi:hypothetical protein